MHLERLEPYLLEQTKTNLQQSLTGADRLGDFLQGSALMVWYLFRKGKSAEGAFHAAGECPSSFSIVNAFLCQVKRYSSSLSFFFLLVRLRIFADV